MRQLYHRADVGWGRHEMVQNYFQFQPLRQVRHLRDEPHQEKQSGMEMVLRLCHQDGIHLDQVLHQGVRRQVGIHLDQVLRRDDFVEDARQGEVVARLALEHQDDFVVAEELLHLLLIGMDYFRDEVGEE
jgi:hypothetical protein